MTNENKRTDKALLPSAQAQLWRHKETLGGWRLQSGTGSLLLSQKCLTWLLPPEPGGGTKALGGDPLAGCPLLGGKASTPSALSCPDPSIGDIGRSRGPLLLDPEPHDTLWVGFGVPATKIGDPKSLTSRGVGHQDSVPPAHPISVPPTGTHRR